MLKTSLTISSMAVVATGVAVATGSLSLPAVSDAATNGSNLISGSAVASAGTDDSGPARTSALTPAAADSTGSAGAAADRGSGTPQGTGGAGGGAAAAQRQSAERAEVSAAAADRQQSVTRSDERTATDSAKADSLALGQGNTLSRSESLSDQGPEVIAQALLGQYGWSADQFGCLDSLWTRESGWNVHADNPSSSAYGIPQALPGSKMASAGPDWANNAVTQITWGLGYIRERYGSPCGAWAHSQSSGFY